MQLPDAPTNAPVFIEDLPEEEQDVTGYAKYGAGEQTASMQRPDRSLSYSIIHDSMVRMLKESRQLCNG